MANIEKVDRNKGVIADRKAGMKWKAIAEKWKLYNESYAQKIYKTHIKKYSTE